MWQRDSESFEHWDHGFESRWGHLSGLCCTVLVRTPRWTRSPVQRVHCFSINPEPQQGRRHTPRKNRDFHVCNFS